MRTLFFQNNLILVGNLKQRLILSLNLHSLGEISICLSVVCGPLLALQTIKLDAYSHKALLQPLKQYSQEEADTVHHRWPAVVGRGHPVAGVLHWSWGVRYCEPKVRAKRSKSPESWKSRGGLVQVQRYTPKIFQIKAKAGAKRLIPNCPLR